MKHPIPCLAALMVLWSLGGPMTGFAQSGSRLYRDRLTPHWLSDGARFWYRLETGPGTHEFLLVDAVKATREAAFDHGRLAEALHGRGFTNAPAQALPLSDLDWDKDGLSLKFRAFGRQWTCGLRAYELTDQPAKADSTASDHAWAPGSGPRASRRTGPETSITFINRTADPVEIFWLTPEGERRSYGTIQPSGQREQHTFAGHAWCLRSMGPTQVDLGVFEAQEDSSSFEVTGPVAARPGGPRLRNAERAPQSSLWRTAVRDHNLFIRHQQTGEEKRLTADGQLGNAYDDRVHWAPDGSKLVAMRSRKGTDRRVYLIESSPRDQLQPRLLDYEYAKPGDDVDLAVPRLIDLASACEVPIPDNLFSNAWSITGLRWKADSSEFSFVYNQRGHQTMRVLAVNATNGQPRVVVEETSPTFINYSGSFFCDYLEASGELVWASERDGWNHLYLYDIATGTVKNQVTRGAWVVRGVDRVDPDRRQVWFRASGIHPGQDPYHVHHCRVNLDGTGLVVLTEGDGTHRLEWSPDRRFYIDCYSRVDQPPAHELRRGSDGALLCALETADTRFIKVANPAWRTPERFVARGRDGHTGIHGIIHWPQRMDPGAKYPLIESIYAGPQDAHVPKDFRVHYPQSDLANRGFVVVQIDGMGTAHRGKRFHDVCWRNLADAGLPDRIAWIKAAARHYPAIDLARVGIYGTSAGGQNALGALLLHGDFYQAGVADCGCHDNRMDKIWWNEQWMGWPVGPHYAEQSNVTLAPRLQGKLLLMVGELDRNVDPASTLQVADALIRANKDFEMLVVPGAGHGTLGTPYGKRRLFDFFEKTLGRPN